MDPMSIQIVPSTRKGSQRGVTAPWLWPSWPSTSLCALVCGAGQQEKNAMMSEH